MTDATQGTIDRTRTSNPRIRESWSRCIASGLAPDDTISRRSIPWRDLCRRYDKDVQLREITGPVLDALHDALGADRYSIAFANRDCVIVDALSPQSANGKPLLEEVQIGACWDELSRGTNAIAIVARSGEPTVVRATEHFASDYQPMTCVAAPVYGDRAELLGVLDASTVDAATVPAQTMAMVRDAARQIEAELFCNRFAESTIVRFHAHRSFVHTPRAGLIAIDDDGALQGISRSAAELLDLPVTRRPRNIRGLFKGEAWKPRARPAQARFVDLETKHGRIFPVTLQPPARARSKPSETGGRPRVDGDSGLIFRDPRIGEQLALIDRAVRLSPPILITGETGTGKELVARYVHRSSGRSGQFIPVNSAAVPHDLMEAELFGYTEGAFTGARAGGSSGLVAEADGGTLFLDEIGDMPPSLQATMLRLLDYWTVRPVGSNRERHVDVQLVCATNCDLDAAVQDGRFRADLLHRIKVVAIDVPPIRERNDFEDVVRGVLETIDPAVRVTDEAVARLRVYRWPGNTRELRNVLTRLVLQQDGEAIEERTVLQLLPETADATQADAGGSAFDSQKQQLVVDTYYRNACNVSATARELGISRSTVYSKLRHARIE